MMRRVISKSAAPALGQLDLSARFPDQELDAVGLLQLLDLDGQRRLADMEHTRRRGEAAMGGDRVEGAELAERY
jgi:hypothetical protein